MVPTEPRNEKTKGPNGLKCVLRFPKSVTLRCISRLVLILRYNGPTEIKPLVRFARMKRTNSTTFLPWVIISDHQFPAPNPKSFYTETVTDTRTHFLKGSGRNQASRHSIIVNENGGNIPNYSPTYFYDTCLMEYTSRRVRNVYNQPQSWPSWVLL